jgi:hypothetical protein
LRAPFPWFGGKSRAAHLVWDRFGDVRNYVEPFFGSGAVLLGRQTDPKIETINDLDCWVANFWRALQHDSERLAAHADWPVNEADLHARHLWLVNQVEFRERIKADPEFYDVKIAGWWVWGICQWIGSGWCAERGGAGRQDPPGDPWEKRPNIGDAGRGMHLRVIEKRPRLGNDHGRGVLCAEVTSGFEENRGGGGLYEWFSALEVRLRRVRVCCGDWMRILGPAPTTCIGMTGVFLDPPYAIEDRAEVYGEDSRNIGHEVREWAIANGDNPELRIALCGYEATNYKMPSSWTEIAWKANGGYANQSGKTRGRENAHRERIWFSPHCLCPQQNLFAERM